MATVLMTWELGGGLGHLMQMLPLARGLVERGHTVYAALRDLANVEAVFGPGPVQYLQAPARSATVARPVRPVLTFAHLLHNCGFDDLATLRTATTAWRNLIRLVRPDLILFDHSPTALLASRAFGAQVRRVTIGSGFCVPPDLPDPPLMLRPERGADPLKLIADEQAVLERTNRLLAEWKCPPLARLAQLYSDADDTFLLTYPELDHFPRRAGAAYRGAWTEGRGRPPQWPRGRGDGSRRVYAYLKPFPALPALLEALARSGHSTLVYSDGVPPDERRQYACDTLRFEDAPLHLGSTAKDCDLAVLNAGHGATAAVLMAGKPALLVPIYLEQGMLARAAARNTGAVLEAPPKDGPEAAHRLEAMLAADHYTGAARRFAARYAGFDAAEEHRRMVERMGQLAGGRTAAPAPASRPAAGPPGFAAWSDAVVAPPPLDLPASAGH